MDDGEKDQQSSKQNESNERERNILESLPSRQISTWKRKAKERKKSLARGQRSIDGKLYMPVTDDTPDEIVEVEDSGKYMEHKPLTERLQERRRLRSTSLSEYHSLSCFTGIRYRIAMSFKITLEKLKDWLQMFSLWRRHFKEIEGSFGNGILSFFTFLRWLLLVNLLVFIIALSFLVIPQVVATNEVPAVIVKPGNASNNSTISLLKNLSSDSAVREILREQAGFLGANTTAQALQRGCSVAKPNSTNNYLSKDVGGILSDFMQGMGWINTTVMFYGSYSSKILVMPTGSYYNMPMAYFTVGTLSFVIVLLLTLWSASSIIEESYIKDGVKHHNSYANKVFGGWDMCITDEIAAQLKVKSLVREIEGDLAEDLRLANLSARTQRQKCQIFSIRLAVNMFVLLLSVGAGLAIYEAAQLSLKTAQTDSMVQSSKTEFMDLFKSYASSITITVLNSVLPALFYFLSQLEDWNPRVHVNIDLARTVLLKLASVAVLVISLFQKIDKDGCILCWENAIATEMYKLIWMDFFVVIAVAVAYHTPRRYVADHVDCGIKLGQKIGRPVFLIPQNVLELVYAQCLIWIGMWYSPLLTLMGCIKFFILFYVKKLNLKYNCRPEDKPYRAGKSNYFFMLLLLATFFLCTAAVVYGVSQIRPSLLYGPFRGLYRMYSIVPLTIQTLPIGVQDLYNVVKSPVFVITIVILICLGLYFFYASAKVYSRMIMELREELAMETRDKKYLLKKLGAP